MLSNAENCTIFKIDIIIIIIVKFRLERILNRNFRLKMSTFEKVCFILWQKGGFFAYYIYATLYAPQSHKLFGSTFITAICVCVLLESATLCVYGNSCIW